MTTRSDVYAAISSERDYQDRAWRASGGEPNLLTIGEFILSIEQYTSQARAVWSQEPKPEAGALDIIRKVAGIAVNCMEQHGAPHRASVDEQAKPENAKRLSREAVPARSRSKAKGDAQ